ncbi:type VII secretion-associated serine protease mycosin [Streptomyces sp. NBC_01465]|uniref:type VII secretion-associated serine protease mycosin n=1 Tax=Streptomyces sp. NBC_01465 TaxID=2903878 RepID=UPI002E33DAE5|nr:type VII secretion-associated serine protease mycosin [Streptomyces sp. NBC_01465]
MASADYIRDKQWILKAFDAESVWSQSKGQGVTVAVVDTGVDGSHPDLTGQVLPGKDFLSAGGSAHRDLDGHGTSLASEIAGHGHGAHHADGVMGLAPAAKILPLRISSNGKDIHDATWAPAVRYAVDHGAKVINLSFGGGGTRPGSDGAEAVAYAQAHDVVVVAGSGNDGHDSISYPAALPGVVSVGAVDGKANVWDDSNYGHGLTITAPGVNIVGAKTSSPSGYAEGSGTSDSTAYVSAAVALVRAKFPDLTAGQVINRLIKSTTYGGNTITKKPDDKFGYGILRPYSALTMSIPAGPKEGPLGQAPAAKESGGAPGTDRSTDRNSEESAASSSSPSSGALLAIVGGIAAVVVIGIGIVVAVIIRRRNRGGPGGPGGPGGGTPVQGYGGYPHQPQYPAHVPGQAPPNPHPYAQQPPQGYPQQPPYQGL